MTYQSVPQKVNFPQIAQEVLRSWQEQQIFQKSLTLSQKEHVFYDGPPFPTGSPHHGTIFVSILKDSLARFFTMDGFNVPRRWGWDCHGLPIENAVEKQMGLQSKTQIENEVGIAPFNQACRDFVSQANDAWETYINKVGRWTEYRNAYRTMDTSFMESVLWVFKTCYDKGLIYKDYRVTPYCTHCETSLSISDTRESDSTRPKQDPALIVTFRAHEAIGGKPTFFLAWTTTPWTLPSNLALAVGKDFNYVAVEKDEHVYILAEPLLGRYKKELGEAPTLVAEFKGEALIGQTYEPLFPYFKEMASQGAFRVIAGDFVTLEDGVGIVHIAPAFGEDDYWACKRQNIAVRNPVNIAGLFTPEVADFQGRHVLEANSDIIRQLKQEHKVLKHETIEHNYPHCWRCREPLIYRAMDAWYFAVEKIKDRLQAQNAFINWVPEHVKEGRFGKWLEGCRDWNISRSRYWGTPIPVWECSNSACQHREVLGSLAEIEQKTGIKLEDLHKEFMDPLQMPCPKCQSPMIRVPEVLDCWFESGAMPYGQCHYPFENKEWFESHFPCDFIVEYPGQIRCWFYYLHVLAVALFDRPAFRNCVVHGTLLAADGSKISKSKKNYTDPMELIDRYGADAMRIYLMSSPAAEMQDLRFEDSGIESQVKDVLLPLWNAYSFFVIYANIDGFQGSPALIPQPTNKLDRWILAKLYLTEREVHQAYETYHLNKTLNPILSFLEDLTNWYIRRSRERFWGKGIDPDKQSAFETLYYVLVNMSKMLAPSAPFITEVIFRNLAQEESVHLSAWPRIPESFANPGLIEEFDWAMLITNLGLSLRQSSQLKVRQPLPAVRVALPKEVEPTKILHQAEIITSELNVKRIEFIDDPSQMATIYAVPNSKVLGKQLGKDMQKVIQGAAKGQVREEGEQVIVTWEGQEWKLKREDIKIGYKSKDGLDVASQRGVLVGLDATLTPELKEEGIANDLNRLIQNMRKEADYQISDSIELEIEGELAENWRQFLAESALGRLTPLSPEQTQLSKSETIEGRVFTVKMRRA